MLPFLLIEDTIYIKYRKIPPPEVSPCAGLYFYRREWFYPAQKSITFLLYTKTLLPATAFLFHFDEKWIS